MTTANTMVDGSGRLICSIKVTSLNQAEIFVFGSNAAGRHAGGAARYAMDHFGAKFGRGHGLHGRSYAVDTMSGIQVLGDEVRRFLDFASDNPGLTFLVTEIGTGIAGHSPERIAPLFSRAPENVALPLSFVRIIDDPRSEWTLRVHQLQLQVRTLLKEQLEDRSLFSPPTRLEEDPLWDPFDIPATEARLRLLRTEEAAGNPLIPEIWRLRHLNNARVGEDASKSLAESADELLLRLLFDQHRDAEIVDEFEAMGGIQMGTNAWAEQLGWIAESRVLWARGQRERAMDRLLLALEHSPGPWGQADPDYLLRGLCDLALLDAPWLGGRTLQKEVASLARFVAALVQPWRGAWYDALVEEQLRALNEEIT